MRRALPPVLGLAMAGALASGVQGFAASTNLPLPRLALTTGVLTAPKALPKREFSPASVTFFAKVRTTDGTHPSALRELVLNIDRDVRIDAAGLPVCRGGGRQVLDPTRARRVCRSAVVGSGVARFAIASPDQAPIVVSSPIVVFNGATEGGEARLLVHAVITAPVPAAIVSEVTIRKKGGGIDVVANIPATAGGSGSLLDLRFRVGRKFAFEGKPRSLVTARCPDGTFEVSVPEARFRNEARTPGTAAQTILKERVLAPCTPKG